MSTRSRIGIIRGSNATKPVVESIYCHYDGYPEGVGQHLLDHWTDPKKVNRLIVLGDLSSLGSKIGHKHDFDTHQGERPPYPGLEASDEEREAYFAEVDRLRPESAYAKGWCLFYGRDRGEADATSVVHGMDNWPDSGQEAEYLFDPATRTWKVRQETLNPVGWNTVTPWEGWLSIPEAILLEQAAQASTA